VNKTTADYLKLLGLRCRDVVTGFEGVTESISYDLYGCVQAVVRPSIDKAKPADVPDGRWFDCKRLVVIDQKPVMDVPAFASTEHGAEIGPAEKPRRTEQPSR
jgi:hypothetical protein